MTDEQREQLEAAIEAAHLRPFQAMVVRAIAGEENMTAALAFLEQVRGIGDGTATTD